VCVCVCVFAHLLGQQWNDLSAYSTEPLYNLRLQKHKHTPIRQTNRRHPKHNSQAKRTLLVLIEFTTAASTGDDDNNNNSAHYICAVRPGCFHIFILLYVDKSFMCLTDELINVY